MNGDGVVGRSGSLCEFIRRWENFLIFAGLELVQCQVASVFFHLVFLTWNPYRPEGNLFLCEEAMPEVGDDCWGSRSEVSLARSRWLLLFNTVVPKERGDQ